MSFPADEIVNELPDTDLTVPFATIVFALPAAMADDGAPHGKADRKTDLPRQLLSSQGKAREADLPDSDGSPWRTCARDDGGAADAARRGSQNREPGPDSVVQEPEEHLRRHPRTSD